MPLFLISLKAGGIGLNLTEGHQSKCYHLGMGRNPIVKTTFATANQNRDYRIFEDFAFFIMAQARKKRATDIFKLKGNVYVLKTVDLQ